jgi:hypothetical protein
MEAQNPDTAGGKRTAQIDKLLKLVADRNYVLTRILNSIRIDLRHNTLSLVADTDDERNFLHSRRALLEEMASQSCGRAISVIVQPVARSNAAGTSKNPSPAKPPAQPAPSLAVAGSNTNGQQAPSHGTTPQPSRQTDEALKHHALPAQPNRAARRRLQHDVTKMEQTLRRFCRDGDAIEIRALNCQPGNFTTVGYFDKDHLGEAARLATRIDASGIYFTINPVKADLLARAANRLQPRPKFSGTADGDIARRDWLFLDFDPVRASGISATDEEKLLAMQRAEECRQFLADRGWVPPLSGDSGNGAHLNYPIALPNNSESRVLNERVLKALAMRFSDDQVALDLTTFNAARITKLYGTVAGKGDDTDKRPHRLSSILEDPGLRPGEIVTAEQLGAVAALLPEEPARVSGTNTSGREFDLEHWIREHNPPVRGPLSYGTDLKWLGIRGENCPFGGDHDSGGFFLIKRAGGPIQAGCHHNSCQGRSWRDLRLQYEPDAYSRNTQPDPDSDLAVLGAAPADDRKSISTDSNAQIKPEPLYRDLPPGEDFPVDALGKIGGAAARNIHEATGAPLAICAQSVLAAMNLAVAGYVDVELPTGEVKPTSEFFATIASSGERKTAADNRATEEFRKFEKEQDESYREEKFAYLNAVEAWEKVRAEALKQHNHDKKAKAAALQENGPKPEAPISPMMLAGGEPTIEGLIRLFYEGGVSVAGMFTDEGGSFIGGHAMNEEARLRTAAALSKLWDGDALRRVRGGDGFYVVKGRRLSAHLLIQPDAAQQMFADPVLRDQGLLTRFLAILPERAAGSRTFIEVSDFSHLSHFSQTVRQLLAQGLPYEAPQRPRDGLNPQVLTLSEEAAALWVAFYQYVEGLLGDGKPLDDVVGLANKAPEHATRLAGTRAYFNEGISILSGEHMQAGIDLVRYYLTEAIRIRHAATIDTDLELSKKLLAWLRHGWEEPDGLISLPDIYQQCPHHGLRTKDIAARIVKILEGHGWLVHVLPTKVNGTRRRDVWQIVKE